MHREFPIPHEPFDGSVEETPLVQLWYALLRDALKRSYEQIHVRPSDSAAFTVRAFHHGSWREMMDPPVAMYPAFLQRLKVMANLNMARRLPLEEGRFRFHVDDSVFEIKVTVRAGPGGVEEAIIDLPAASIGEQLPQREGGAA